MSAVPYGTHANTLPEHRLDYRIITCTSYADAVAVDLIFSGRIFTVGIGTVLSVLLVGRFVGWFGKLFPKLTMPPFWNTQKS